MFKTLFTKTTPKTTYGNPFESNVLVRVIHNNDKQVHSFFVHELPPNCPVEHLRERISERNIVPFTHWEMYIPTRGNNKKRTVLVDGKVLFGDYGVQSWDCICVRNTTDKNMSKEQPCGGRSYTLRACGTQLAKNVVATIGKRCFSDCRVKGGNMADSGYSDGRNRIADTQPRPYGYLSNNSSVSLFSRESLEYGAEQKIHHIL